LVNSVLVTRTALVDHQLHNVINQPFVLIVHFHFLLKAACLASRCQQSCCRPHFDSCRYVYFYSLFHSINCFRIILYTFCKHKPHPPLDIIIHVCNVYLCLLFNGLLSFCC